MAWREHPRACGDDVVVTCAGFTHRGTPPRVRGRRAPAAGRPPRKGNTPARAGTTRPTPRSPRGRSEHPRACGDDDLQRPELVPLGGTPPRVRGRRWRPARWCRRTGNTPARAGTTYPYGPRTVRVREHPRACGDDAHRVVDLEPRRGTPPRVRGRLDPLLDAERRDRNTPARAGTTWTSTGPTRTTTEHPRACGDDARSVSTRSSTAGTPPRVRGRHPRGRLAAVGGGNTPARAGTTQCSHHPLDLRREHPRACGDDPMRLCVVDSASGTPPRVRGRRLRSGGLLPHLGNTPARAGTT